MKKRSALFLCMWSAAFCCCAQNVGIGNTSPAEKLDVTGNINVSGTIKANGVDGAPNQVLMKNNAGVLQWGDMGDFKNLASFYGNGTFTVPAGVTRIAVDVWGAGGGGNSNAGGGGGGYMRAQLEVTPGQTGTVTIGAGGNYAALASGTQGGTSSIVINGFTISAFGGSGASWLSATTNYSGFGGGHLQLIAGLKHFYGVSGTAGGMPKKTYQQFNATTFYETVEGGAGGAAYNAPMAAGQGSYILSNVGTGLPIKFVGGNTDGAIPGGGGAGGLTYVGGETAGGQGGKGLVIVYY